jgi:hypothetical protein
MSRLSKFWSLTKQEKKILCEAILLLSLSSLCVTVIAFRHIDKFLRIRWKDGIQGDNNHEQEIKLVQRSISRAANVLPFKSPCLSQSIAEFAMLRRRGISAVMCAGARFLGNSSLDAHAWVYTGRGANEGSENFDFTTVIKIGTGVDR